MNSYNQQNGQERALERYAVVASADYMYFGSLSLCFMLLFAIVNFLYNKNIKNDVLANLCNLSTVYFRKLFTEIMGASPISYVHELRIKKAKEMLRSDYGNIKDIAESLGYLNIYDFSRTFKKYKGVSPREFCRESLKGDNQNA